MAKITTIGDLSLVKSAVLIRSSFSLSAHSRHFVYAAGSEVSGGTLPDTNSAASLKASDFDIRFPDWHTPYVNLISIASRGNNDWLIDWFIEWCCSAQIAGCTVTMPRCALFPSTKSAKLRPTSLSTSDHNQPSRRPQRPLVTTAWNCQWAPCHGSLRCTDVPAKTDGCLSNDGKQQSGDITHSLVGHRQWRLATADDHSIVFLLHCYLSCDITFSWM